MPAITNQVPAVTSLSPESSEVCALHDNCLLCGGKHPNGYGLVFKSAPDGSVCAEFIGTSHHQGYPSLLHGGVVAALLDSAMTRVLLNRGIPAFTAELTVRYRKPTPCYRPLTLTAREVEHHRHTHRMEARLHDGPTLLAVGRARFMLPPKSQTPFNS